MRRLALTLWYSILGFSTMAQLTLQVNVPQNTPLLDQLQVAGNFNSWNPSDANVVLSTNSDGTYQITFNPPVGNLEFKFTRGGWPSVEADANGVDISDRLVYYGGGPQTETLSVQSWLDLGPTSPTMGSGVYWLDNDILIPQLNRNRRIWVYLPPNYHSSNAHYRVVYMHDAQNLFDPSTSFSGEWEIDESMNSLITNGDPGAIVVGIDNGGQYRIDELTPWTNPTYGGGDGDLYVDFIVQTLKPIVDANFRTLPDREHTAIIGSSLGGLVSMYGAIEHQDVFGKAGILSPSFWFSEDAYTHVLNTGKQDDMRIYLMAGEQESSTMVPNLTEMYNTLITAGFQTNELSFATHWDGEHSEWYWRREFPWVYLWLFANTTVSVEEELAESVRIFPNPFAESCVIDLNGFESATRLFVIDVSGREMKAYVVGNNRITINKADFGTGVFLLYAENENGSRRFLEKLVVLQ